MQVTFVQACTILRVTFSGKLKCLPRAVSKHDVIAAQRFHWMIQQALHTLLMIMWTLLHIRLSSALRFVNISNMDKFVVKSKWPADVEDSNLKNEANKKTKSSTSTPVSDSQKYMASRGGEINRSSHPLILAIWTTPFFIFTMEHCLRLKMLFQHVSSTYQPHARNSQCNVLTVPSFGLICSYTHK